MKHAIRHIHFVVNVKHADEPRGAEVAL